jgi:hypothetical protein
MDEKEKDYRRVVYLGQEERVIVLLAICRLSLDSGLWTLIGATVPQTKLSSEISSQLYAL